MHIRIIARAALPGGGIANPGAVLDLPEGEARPLLDSGHAELEPKPQPEPQPEPKPEPKPKPAKAPKD
jgi:outer membrane biosynthesis protein TonB